MKLNIDTEHITIKELDALIYQLQGELALKREQLLKRNYHKSLTDSERLSRLKKMDEKRYPNMVRIFNEDNKKSFLVPYIMANTGYKLVKAYDFRKGLRRKMPFAWSGGYREGEQALFMDVPHSEDRKVLICGIDAFKDNGDEDFNHPRFAV